MSIPDETLMAYADGELDAARRAEVEAAIAADPNVAARVEQHRALRRKLSAAFDPVMQETIPHALIAAARTSPAAAPSAAMSSSAEQSAAGPGAAQRGAATDRAATVTDLRRVRAARAAEAKEAAAARRGEMPRQQPWTWFEWGAMAASVALGALIAHLATTAQETGRIGTRNGHLVAQADLAEALSTQLAIDQPVDAPVQIGVSFRSKGGATCRTFTVKDQNVLGGLGCRQEGEWRVQVLANAPPGTSSPGGYKPAGGSMPSAVVSAVEKQIDGDPLDATEEAAARARGWK